jgi:hypothetical protein
MLRACFKNPKCLRRGILAGDKAASFEHPRSPEGFRDKKRANAVPGQKNRRPEGFVAKAGTIWARHGKFSIDKLRPGTKLFAGKVMSAS